MRHKKIIAAIVLSVFILGVSMPTLGAAPPISETVSNLEFDIKNIEHNVEPYLPESKTDEKRDIDFNLFRLEKITSITPDKYYGRQALSESANKNVRLYVYDAIVECISNKRTEVSFEDGPYEVYKDDYNAAIHAVQYDYPQFFYYNSSAGYSYSHINGRYTNVNIPYYDFENLDAAKEEFEEKADSIIKNTGITSSMSDYEKAKRLHNALIGWVEYDHEAANNGTADSLAHTSYAAIVNHSAVCDGYAKAYQYLLYKVGILSHIVTGYGQSDSVPENHAWNIVWLDSEPYYVDVTWDDKTKKGSDEGYISVGISYRYFNMDDEILKKDHTINKNIIYESKNKLSYENYSLGYDLPVCSSLDENYYKKEGVWLTSENQNNDGILDEIATMLAMDVKARIYVDEEIDFRTWIDNNINTIYTKYCEKTSCTVEPKMWYSSCANEYELIFIENDTMKVNEDYEVVMYYDGSDSGKLCQMIYDENGAGSYFNLINVEASPSIIRLMMYPWKKNLKCDTAKYMYLNFDSGYKPIIDKFVLEY